MKTQHIHTLTPDTYSLSSYSALCESTQRFHDMVDSINKINSLLFSEEYIFIVYSNRDSKFSTFFKIELDEIVETYYLESDKTYPLLCNQLITRGGSLIATNTRTGFATKVEGRTELCLSTTIPKDAIFQSRSLELMQNLRNSVDQAVFTIR